MWPDICFTVITAAQEGRGVQLYASLMFTYSKSRVLLSLVWQSTYCVRVVAESAAGA